MLVVSVTAITTAIPAITTAASATVHLTADMIGDLCNVHPLVLAGQCCSVTVTSCQLSESVAENVVLWLSLAIIGAMLTLPDVIVVIFLALLLITIHVASPYPVPEPVHHSSSNANIIIISVISVFVFWAVVGMMATIRTTSRRRRRNQDEETADLGSVEESSTMEEGDRVNLGVEETA